MRINMNNHFNSNSVVADLENVDNDIDFSIIKNRGFLTKRVYFRLRFSHNNDNATISLNTEQLKKLAEHLDTYVKSGAYQKRADAQTSKVDTVIW